MTRYRSSKDNFSFSKIAYETRLKQNASDTDASEMVEWYNQQLKDDQQKQFMEEFKKTFEYSLRTSDIMCEKVLNDCYAQNLYAAICNNDFVKDGITNYYSWRAAGRIIANMREQGDYIDWYCSGITPEDTPAEQAARFENYVNEGTVTPEVQTDIERLGWKIVGVSSEKSQD